MQSKERPEGMRSPFPWAPIKGPWYFNLFQFVRRGRGQQGLLRIPLTVIGCSQSPAPFSNKGERNCKCYLSQGYVSLFYKAWACSTVCHSLYEKNKEPPRPRQACDAKCRILSRAYLSHIPSDWNHDQPKTDRQGPLRAFILIDGVRMVGY